MKRIGTISIALCAIGLGSPAPAQTATLTANPSNPVTGDTVLLDLDAGGVRSRNPCVMAFGTQLTSNGQYLFDPLPLALGFTDVQGSFTYQQTVPSGLDGWTFYLHAFGLEPGIGLWESNLDSLTVGGGAPSWFVPKDGSLGTIYDSKAVRGDVIEVSGTIGHTEFDRKDSGLPLIIQAGAGGALITMNSVGGSDTIGFKNASDTQVWGVLLEPDDRAAVMFNTHTAYRGIEFHECKIGKASGRFWDAYTDTGFQGKWGVLSYELDGFVWDGGEIIGIGLEHAMYHHNPRASSPTADAIVVKNATMKHCGRTAVQVVARTSEGPDGQGNVTVQNCYIEDVCLEDGGGGSALTFRGNLDGTVLIENTTVKLGCDPNLSPNVSNNITGALVMDSGDGAAGRGTRELIIRNCWFEVGSVFPGVSNARRANANISMVDRLEITNTTMINHPGASTVLDIGADSIQQIVLDDDNDIRGDCTFAGYGTFKDSNRDGTGYRDMLTAIANDPRVTIQ